MPNHRKSQPIQSNNTCLYGCGNLVRFISPGGKEMCESSANKCPTNRLKNSKAISAAHDDGRIPGWNQIPNLNRGWSNGLTKNTDSRIKSRPSQVGKRFGLSLTGHTAQSKEKLSIRRTEYLENSNHIQWMQLPNGIKVQGSWEYNVGCTLLQNGYTLTRPRIIYDSVRRYTPDFCIAQNVYIEVKGWLSNRDIEKYTKVLSQHKDIKIYLIRDEKRINNYTKFINQQISLEECEDLRTVLGC